MLVVLSHYPGDEEQALRLATWIKDLGPYPGHELLLIADVRSTRSLAIRAEFDRAGFDKIEELVNPSIIDGWPHAANFVFSMAARHIAATNSRPFLWLEPDVVPMRGGWLDTLQTAYTMGGQPFFGDYVNVDNVPPHCSGIAIYPGDLIEAGAGNALIAGDIAWDCAVATQVLPKLHKTKLIGHAWRHPPFANRGELDNLRGQHPDMVLFHADKSGSLIDLLRTERAGKQEITLPATPKRDLEASAAQQRAICDLFIKTWAPDYEWLQYCARSIDKFATGFRNVVIVHPTGEGWNWDFQKHFNCATIQVGEQPDGYLWQQVIKLDADRYTDASHIVYLDSDTVFTRPVTPETFFKDGKVVWMFTPFEKLSTPWKEMTEKFLKRPVAYEHMRRHPLVIPRWLLGELRAFCEREHGVTLDAYILSQPHRAFSEWNAIGSFAHEFFKDEFHWVNTEEVAPENWPILTVKQYWSRGGISDEIRKELEQTVAEAYNDSDGETSVVPRIGDNGDEPVPGEGIEDAPEPEESSSPTLPIRLSAGAAKWDRVEQLVLELKGYCDSPIATSRVRKALEGGKILPTGTITKIQRRKWRKNYRRKRKANRAS